MLNAYLLEKYAQVEDVLSLHAHQTPTVWPPKSVLVRNVGNVSLPPIALEERYAPQAKYVYSALATATALQGIFAITQNVYNVLVTLIVHIIQRVPLAVLLVNVAAQAVLNVQ